VTSERVPFNYIAFIESKNMDIKGGIKGGLQIPDILENLKEQEIKNQKEEIKKYFKTQVENCPNPPESPLSIKYLISI
jgi:hypothetical protein